MCVTGYCIKVTGVKKLQTGFLWAGGTWEMRLKKERKKLPAHHD